MSRYIALIRGINVGGKNKVSMPELKTRFEKAGFQDVITYINSGNIFFSASDNNAFVDLVQIIETVLRMDFNVITRVAVVPVSELHKALAHAPTWWDQDPDSKHNAIFVIAPTTAAEVMKTVGEAKPEYESVESYGHVIFWSAPLKTFSRTRWSKIVGTAAYNSVTTRNANTFKKLVELSNDSAL